MGNYLEKRKGLAREKKGRKGPRRKERGQGGKKGAKDESKGRDGMDRVGMRVPRMKERA